MKMQKREKMHIGSRVGVKGIKMKWEGGVIFSVLTSLPCSHSLGGICGNRRHHCLCRSLPSASFSLCFLCGCCLFPLLFYLMSRPLPWKRHGSRRPYFIPTLHSDPRTGQPNRQKYRNVSCKTKGKGAVLKSPLFPREVEMSSICSWFINQTRSLWQHFVIWCE